MEKAVRAFVSHIRAYSKHECGILLKVKELPLGAVASTYGLLQLPKMPELKNRDISDFPEVPNLDINSIPYRNKERETIRKKKLEQYNETGRMVKIIGNFLICICITINTLGVWPGSKNKTIKKQTVPWSIAKQKKDERKEKRKKRKQIRALKKDSDEPAKKKKRGGILILGIIDFNIFKKLCVLNLCFYYHLIRYL